MERLGSFIADQWYLFLALIVILALLFVNLGKTRLLGYREIKPTEAVELINHDGAVVIDTRDAEEFDRGHIVNALNLPFSSLEDRIRDLDEYRDHAVIVCCANGRKSAHAGAILRGNGFHTVYKLAGGLRSWENAGFPLNRI
jgi:rhodanese-related sulfurtransferase